MSKDERNQIQQKNGFCKVLSNKLTTTGANSTFNQV